jgi:amidohydrolase
MTGKCRNAGKDGARHANTQGFCRRGLDFYREGNAMSDPSISTYLKRHEAELIAIRRDIHAHPETGFEEFRTAALIAERLRSWGIETVEGIGGTGVVGTLVGNRPGDKIIALRAEMDALNMTEKSDVPHKSTIPGKMHGCGHDGHSAMLLGAARYLAEHPDFAGTVRFIFQPAEEGLGGARVMLEDGLLARFPVDAFYGMHNQPGRPVGDFGIRVGPTLAASDTWIVTFRGTGGHGGSGAHTTNDPTICLANFLLGLHTLVARNVPAIEPAVLSVGHIHAGDMGSPNVIPAEVVVTGTARCFSPAVRDLLELRIDEMAQGIAATHKCAADVTFTRRYPPTVNASMQTQIAADVAADFVGENRLDRHITLNMGADDFSFMAEQRPSAFIRIGNGVAAQGKPHLLHTPFYDFNDAILITGAEYWVRLVQKELA